MPLAEGRIRRDKLLHQRINSVHGRGLRVSLPTDFVHEMRFSGRSGRRIKCQSPKKFLSDQGFFGEPVSGIPTGSSANL
jgi:hypothetical protein